MVHETRVIPLDGSPHVAPQLDFWMGDARGHWEGETLVVETTNIREAAAYRGASKDLKIIERFTPITKDELELGGRFRGPRDVDHTVGVRDAAEAQRGGGAVRVRVPRGQSRPAKYSERRARWRSRIRFTLIGRQGHTRTWIQTWQSS